ncbi:hypothetical protein [Azospirillum argentinense]
MLYNAGNPEIIRTRPNKIWRTMRIFKNHIIVCLFESGH